MPEREFTVPLTTLELCSKVAKRYKVAKLRAHQRAMPDVYDDVAVALNSEPTYDEIQLVTRMWEFFQAEGAVTKAEVIKRLAKRADSEE